MRAATTVETVELDHLGPSDAHTSRTTKRVLLVANHPAFNKNMLRWAHVLRATPDWVPILISVSGALEPAVEQMELDRDLTILYPDSGLGWLTPSDPQSGADQPRPAAWIAMKALLRGPLESLARTALLGARVLRNVSVMRRQLWYLRRLIREHDIAAVLLSESSPAYGATVFVQAARACGIPVITAPIDHFNRADHAEMYLTDELLGAQKGLKRLVANRYPRWAVTYKDRRILRVHLDLLLAYEWLGWASPAPWRMVGAWEDAVAVTSAAMSDFYLGEGLAPDLLHVVGSPELDLISKHIESSAAERAELRATLGLPPQRPIILTALVAHHYLHGRPGAEYETYAEMVEGWVKPLGEITGYSVIVNLHPSQRVEAFEYIERWGVKICQRDITALVPLCDIFVACSSTSRLAIACGTPVVYYDIYRYSSASPTLAFQGAGGTFTVLDRAGLVDVMHRLTSDPAFYGEVRARQQATAAHWGVVDGKSATRLGLLLDALVSRTP